MHVFVTAKETTASSNKFVRAYPAGELNGETPVDKMFVDCGGESKVLQDAFAKLEQDKPEAERAPSPVSLVGEPQLIAWEPCPPRMGRYAAKLLTAQLHLHDESEPLILQLKALKAQKPNKQHFRFAVINAYGTNLGDATLGSTAMRYVAKVIEEYLGSFNADIFVGVQANPANADIVSHEPWVASVFFQSPTLQAFTRYDGYFDFTNLINLPRIMEMPTVDWYLWWCGLNPDIISPEHKRNRMPIRWDAWQQIANLLRNHPAKKRVLFNPKASVPLRSCPPEIAANLVKKLIDADKDCHVVIDQPLTFTHKRLIDLSGKIDSPTKFMALVAQLDGVITVDSFAPQLADACSTPTVHITTTLPPETYPYYPHSQVVEIPNARSLPAWKKFKLATEEEWIEIKADYEKAWSALDMKQIMKLLNEKIQVRQSTPVPVRPKLVDGTHQHVAIIKKQGKHLLKYEQASDIWLRGQLRLTELTSVIAKPGMTFVAMTPGRSDYPLSLIEKLTELGNLHVFEPRSARRQLMSMDVLDRLPNANVIWHQTIPVPNCKQVKINQTDVYSQSNPAEWGNLREQIEIPAVSIDGLSLAACHCMTFMPPMPAKMVLAGAMETIRKYRPSLIFSYINKVDAQSVVSLLKDDKYQFWAESAKFQGDFENMIMLGFPNEQKLNLSGFTRVQL